MEGWVPAAGKAQVIIRRCGHVDSGAPNHWYMGVSLIVSTKDVYSFAIGRLTFCKLLGND